MKTILLLAALFAGSPVAAFQPVSVVSFSSCTRSPVASPSWILHSEAPGNQEEEEGGLDLDLGEMFEMFDAADKGQEFDKVMEKVKGDQ